MRIAASRSSMFCFRDRVDTLLLVSVGNEDVLGSVGMSEYILSITLKGVGTVEM